MLRTWVLIVFTEIGQLGSDLGPGQVRREVAQHAQLAGAEPLRLGCGDPGRRRRMARAGRRRCRSSNEACAVSWCGRALEQVSGACDGERKDEPVRLGEGESMFDGVVGRAPVAEAVLGERGQQVGFDDGEVTGDGHVAVEHAAQGVEGGMRVAAGQVDHCTCVADLAQACLLVGEGVGGRLGPPRASRCGPGWPASTRSPGRRGRAGPTMTAGVQPGRTPRAPCGGGRGPRAASRLPGAATASDARPGVCLQGLLRAL